MKLTKQIALSAFLALSVFCAILYTSCSKDACGSVVCLNKGTCRGGSCSCPTGTGGANCQTVYIRSYINNYSGSAVDDTAVVYPNQKLLFTAVSDTDYTSMQLEWQDSTGGTVVKLPVSLDTNLTSGSTFTVKSTNNGIATYTGNGTISATNVSLYLKAVYPAPADVRYFTFSSLVRH